jgi:hypothetical protein
LQHVDQVKLGDGNCNFHPTGPLLGCLPQPIRRPSVRF